MILRGLDGLTDEKRLLDALGDVTSLAPVNCYVMRNLKTNVSLGYADTKLTVFLIKSYMCGMRNVFVRLNQSHSIPKEILIFFFHEYLNIYCN